MNTNFIWVTQM